MKKTVISIFLMMFCSVSAEQFKMTGKLIKAKISYQNLNRISMKDDKIDTLVGIDSAFHFEKNEKTGEVFIRPTEENGHNPLSISVTTTAGKTQDLLLEVVDGEANSIELISNYPQEDPSNQFLTSEYSPDLDEGVGGNDYEENIAMVMKKFINLSSKYKKLELKVEDRRDGFTVARFQEAYQIDDFLCLKFQITGDLKNCSYILKERMFSRKGDIALSLSSWHSDNKNKATLYVLRR